jgi:hypothetical protein
MPIKSPLPAKIPVSILAGLGSGLVFVSMFDLGIERSTRSPQVAERTALLPLVVPIVSIETSDPGDLRTTAGVATTQQQPVRLNSAQIALKDAKVAVSLSQAQLAQARINLSEFQAKHDKAKVLSAQGKVSRKQADLAVAAYKLAQLQHSSAAIGLRDSQTQLIAAKAEVSKLCRKANTVNQM